MKKRRWAVVIDGKEAKRFPGFSGAHSFAEAERAKNKAAAVTIRPLEGW